MKGAEGKAKQEESLLPIKLSDLLCTMKIHNCNEYTDVLAQVFEP